MARGHVAPRGRILAGVAAAVAAGAGGPPAARAQASGAAEADAAEAGAPAGRDHQWQIGGFAHLASGYRAVLPYDDEFCGDAGKAVCLGRSPVRIDVGATFGVLPALELVVEAQLGIERDFGTGPADEGPRILAIAPGIQGRLGDLGAGGFYSTLQLAIDTSDYDQASEADLAVRNENRLQFDLGGGASGYAFVAETVGWRRWLRLELEVGVGVAARFL